MHVAVAPVGTEDAAAPAHFIEANANRAGSTTKHVGIEWVDLGKLLDHRWRNENMYHDQCLVVAAVRETLRKHVISADVVCGEKRQRGASSDLEDDPGIEHAVARAEALA